jgi:hypothetical protein
MRRRTWAIVAVAALVGACASEVRRHPVELIPAGPDTGTRYRSTAALEFRLATGYGRTIPADTEFAAIGRVAPGLVLKPVQTVLTIEGAHVHEAYAVLADGRLVGFYLPVERAYSPLTTPVPWPLIERTR